MSASGEKSKHVEKTENIDAETGKSPELNNNKTDTSDDDTSVSTY